jgi:molybdopterin molybdotransferase
MTLMPVAEAQAAIVSGVEPLDAETVSIFEATGRILAQDLCAKLTQPPFAASAMDGYAVRQADIASLPSRLKVIGRSLAGRGFDGEVRAGEAVRIFTGAPVPAGADTIVIQENTKAADDGAAVEILEPAPIGQHIRPRGYDFCEGDTLLSSGMELASRELMLAAAMNNATVVVRRKPIIAVLANGDELVPPGQSPGSGQIISSIPAGMKGAIAAWGGESLLLDLAQDSKESLAARVRDAQEADVLLTIGGASVGEHDLVRGALEDMGARFEVLKVAMRPGKPVMFGFLNKQRILSMPGNPVSAIICARVFLKPLLDRFLGRARRDEPRIVRLVVPLDANGEREHYMRAKLSEDGVAPIRDQDSSLMSVFANADCLLVRPVRGPALPAGALVRVIPLDF